MCQKPHLSQLWEPWRDFRPRPLSSHSVGTQVVEWQNIISGILCSFSMMYYRVLAFKLFTIKSVSTIALFTLQTLWNHHFRGENVVNHVNPVVFNLVFLTWGVLKLLVKNICVISVEVFRFFCIFRLWLSLWLEFSLFPSLNQINFKFCLFCIVFFLGPRGPLVEPSISPSRPPVPSRPATIFPEFIDEL